MHCKSIIAGFVLLIITSLSCNPSQEDDQRRRLPDLSFTEELKILSDGTEFETKFDYIYDLAVGPAGNIFVADRSRLKVFKYSPDGTFITSFGGEGKGPGELVSLSGFGLIDSTVYVWDQNSTRMNLYDLQGESAGQVVLKGITSHIEVVKVGRQTLLLYPEQYRSPFDSAKIAHLYKPDFGEVVAHFMRVNEINHNLEALNPYLNSTSNSSIEFIPSNTLLYVPSVYGNIIFEFNLDESEGGKLVAEHRGIFTQQPFTEVQGINDRKRDVGYYSAHIDNPIEIVAHNQSRGLFKVQEYIFHFVQVDIGEKREFGAEVYTDNFDPIGFIPIYSIPITTKKRNSLYWFVEEADNLGNFYFGENYPDSSRVRKMHLDLAALEEYK